jgi:hypothetical protein
MKKIMNVGQGNNGCCFEALIWFLYGETEDVSIVEILIELSKWHCKYGSI